MGGCEVSRTSRTGAIDRRTSRDLNGTDLRLSRVSCAVGRSKSDPFDVVADESLLDERERLALRDHMIELASSVAHEINQPLVGMCLAISRSIVEAHGGRLWVTPNEGHGVAFHFSLAGGSGDNASRNFTGPGPSLPRHPT